MLDARKSDDSFFGTGRIDHHQSAAHADFGKSSAQLDCLLTAQNLGGMLRVDAHENVTLKSGYGVHRVSFSRIVAIESASRRRSKGTWNLAQ
jgi:hypothetical protein